MAAGLAGRSFLPGRYGGGGQALLCARGGEFCCPGFNAGMNGCEVYAARPLDCRLYPFVLMYEAGGGGVWLGVDGCCPVVGRRREGAGRGWRVRERAVEYVYARRELAELRGGGYAKQRQMCNRFEREHEWVWRPYVAKDFPAAVRLYGEWLAQRRRVYPEPFFAAQGEAFFRAVVRGLRDADALGLTVRVLEADGEMAGITGGLGLHDGRSFGVLFEVTDLSVKGAAQFIFREFCRETAGFDYVNVGGASGLANLARVKESYLPFDRPGSAVLAPTRTREGV